jgi:magnesium transporter
VRYDDPKPFALIEHKLGRSCSANVTGESVFVDLLDAIIDRSADILERIGAEVDQISLAIFEPDDSEAPLEYNAILKQLGRKGDLTSKVRESLVSINRLLLFLANEADTMRWAKDTRAQLKSMQRDVGSLSDHATYLTNKVTFLLDALLGSVSIKQNDIIKIFSIAAVVFMPPTLVASIYGMNFHHNMIELDWTYGYPFALMLMVAAAVVPYLIFKWKKWI